MLHSLINVDVWSYTVHMAIKMKIMIILHGSTCYGVCLSTPASLNQVAFWVSGSGRHFGKNFEPLLISVSFKIIVNRTYIISGTLYTVIGCFDVI